MRAAQRTTPVFLAAELLGAVTGAASQWAARLAPPPLARRTREYAGANGGYGGALGEAAMRVERNTKRMTEAIAQRDFHAARAWYFEDVKAREDLRILKDRYGIDD